MKHNISSTRGTLIAILAMVAFAVLTGTLALAAEDGAALYKKRCAGCHGSQGEGKASMKAPSLKTTTKDANQIAEHLTKGEPASKAPHNKGISGLTPEDAKAIAAHVKTLQ
jgi:mono/diheme cytochrome c family protein